MVYTAAVMLVLAAVAAYAAYEQGQQAQEVQKYNAKVQENRAIEETQRAAFDAQRSREQSRRILANQRAVYGSSGVDVAAGSPLLVMADSAKQAELDAQVILSGGQARASDAWARANIARYQGKAAAQAGTINAGTTLLSGATRAYGTYAGTGGGGGGGSMVDWSGSSAYASYRAGERG